MRRLAKQREKKLRDEVKHRNKMSPEEVAARVRVRAWGASTRVIDLERSQLNAAKRKSFPDGMVMEATTQQYGLSKKLACAFCNFACLVNDAGLIRPVMLRKGLLIYWRRCVSW